VEPFYVAGGLLAAWALIVTAIGVRRENFPATPGATRLVGAISIVLVVMAIGLAIYLSATEEEEEEGGGEHAALVLRG
jgi:Tfp pilus assembly protein PilO